MKLKWLQLEETNASSEDILPSVSSSLQAKNQTKKWLNSSANYFDSTLDLNPTVQEITGAKGEADAPAPAESNPKPALTRSALIRVQGKVANLHSQRDRRALNPSNPTSINLIYCERKSASNVTLDGHETTQTVSRLVFWQSFWLAWMFWSFLSTVDKSVVDDNAKM